MQFTKVISAIDTKPMIKHYLTSIEHKSMDFEYIFKDGQYMIKAFDKDNNINYYDLHIIREAVRFWFHDSVIKINNINVNLKTRMIDDELIDRIIIKGEDNLEAGTGIRL